MVKKGKILNAKKEFEETAHLSLEEAVSLVKGNASANLMKQ